MSEHVEMYLVMIALLREDTHVPVPLSLLAQKLAISPVSANEMCRKLDEQGLVQYQPYKGVTLTARGEADAQVILSRRRLWVVFLVEELEIEPDEADAIACQLEHITSERLVNALKAYLQHAPSNTRPRRLSPADTALTTRSLTDCVAGQQGTITAITADKTTTDFLHAQGLIYGGLVTVLASGDTGALLLNIGTRHMSLAAPLAAQIMVALPADAPERFCTWDRCRAFWSRSQNGVSCSRLADTNGGALPCVLDCPISA